MTRLLLTALFAVMLLPPLPGMAADGNKSDKEAIPPGALYRYRTEEGQLVVSSTLPRKAVRNGYEIIDRQGRVIREVDPAPTQEDLDRMADKQREKEKLEQRKKEDKRLLRLYAGPEDAIRARDRQLEALKLNVEYNRNSIHQVEEKLSEEISSAARFERQGKEVPESIRQTIDRYQRQVRELNDEVEQYQRDMEQVREKFAPIIQRLHVLTDKEENPASTDTTDPSDSVPEDQTAE